MIGISGGCASGPRRPSSDLYPFPGDVPRASRVHAVSKSKMGCQWMHSPRILETSLP